MGETQVSHLGLHELWAKDVVMLGGYQEIEFDFVADNPGMTLFHCHQRPHLDFGFMALFEYV